MSDYTLTRGEIEYLRRLFKDQPTLDTTNYAGRAITRDDVAGTLNQAVARLVGVTGPPTPSAAYAPRIGETYAEAMQRNTARIRAAVAAQKASIQDSADRIAVHMASEEQS